MDPPASSATNSEESLRQVAWIRTRPRRSGPEKAQPALIAVSRAGVHLHGRFGGLLKHTQAPGGDSIDRFDDPPAVLGARTFGHWPMRASITRRF